ncbi:MAG: hypothetical protein L0Y74_03640, partial [candidate division Zixibacteria bacterium]|nr:hypothetical protein [candidate division Zixibacteria bacterium]
KEAESPPKKEVPPPKKEPPAPKKEAPVPSAPPPKKDSPARAPEPKKKPKASKPLPELPTIPFEELPPKPIPPPVTFTTPIPQPPKYLPDVLKSMNPELRKVVEEKLRRMSELAKAAPPARKSGKTK